MNAKKILVALSGGVDSSTCVALLKEQGCEVAGVVLKMSDVHESTVSDARLAAQQLGIKLYVKDMPLVVIIDSEGNNLYESGRAEYLAAHK